MLATFVTPLKFRVLDPLRGTKKGRKGDKKGMKKRAKGDKKGE